MTINPRDYDLDELRKMARQREPSNGKSNGNGDPADLDPSDLDVAFEEDGSGEAAAGSSFRAGLYRELLPFLGDGVEKPYLDSLPETYAAEFVVFEWLEFLLMHTGYHGAEEALAYYESVDWITEDVQAQLADYLLGIDETGTNDGNDLDVDDHMLSLVYVAKLHSMA